MMKCFSLDQIESLLYCPNGFIRSRDKNEINLKDLLPRCYFLIDDILYSPLMVGYDKVFKTWDLRFEHYAGTFNRSEPNCLRLQAIYLDNKFVNINIEVLCWVMSNGNFILSLRGGGTFTKQIKEALTKLTNHEILF